MVESQLITCERKREIHARARMAQARRGRNYLKFKKHTDYTLYIHTHTLALTVELWVNLFEPRLYVIIKHSLVGMPMNMLHSWYSIYMQSPLSIQSFQTKGITGIKL